VDVSFFRRRALNLKSYTHLSLLRSGDQVKAIRLCKERSVVPRAEVEPAPPRTASVQSYCVPNTDGALGALSRPQRVLDDGADSHRVFEHILALPKIQAAWGRVYLASPLGRHLKSEVTNLDFFADIGIVSRCPRGSELTPVDRGIKRPMARLDD
jgi:hypothetical protein